MVKLTETLNSNTFLTDKYKTLASPSSQASSTSILASATFSEVQRDRVFRLQAAGTPRRNTLWDRVASPGAAGIPRLDAASSWKRPRCSPKSSWNPRLQFTCCWNTHPRLASLEYRSPDKNLISCQLVARHQPPDIAFRFYLFLPTLLCLCVILLCPHLRRTRVPSEDQIH